MSQFEVNDGNTWLAMQTPYVTIELTPEIQELLDWAKAQRTMYMNRLEAAQRNPALLKALESVKRAEENFDLLERISRDYSDEVQQSP